MPVIRGKSLPCFSAQLFEAFARDLLDHIAQVSDAGEDSGQFLDVSSKEFELLKYFICHSGETLSRDRLLEDVWGYDNYPTTRTVDTHLVRLRQKLEPDPEQPRFFLTVHGVGYRFVG